MELTPCQRLLAPHPEHFNPVQVIYLRDGEDRVDVISHHPHVEQRRRQIWVRYADDDPRYEDHEYLVDRDGVQAI